VSSPLAVSREERFRQNEVLRAFAEGAPGPFAFRCECGHADCPEIVMVADDDVYAIRANSRRLVTTVGHESDAERVVLRKRDYLILELVAA
jgi:hypothetical protein